MNHKPMNLNFSILYEQTNPRSKSLKAVFFLIAVSEIQGIYTFSFCHFYISGKSNQCKTWPCRQNDQNKQNVKTRFQAEVLNMTVVRK